MLPDDRAVPRAVRRAAFNAVEQLERRRLYAANIIQVTTGADQMAGTTVTGSLRAAIVAANATPGSTIEFTSLGSTPIILDSALPAITGAGTTIDGTTDAGGSVEIEGTGVPAGGAAIDVQAATVVLKGLAIIDCGPTTTGSQTTYAVRLDTGSSTDTVEGCYIGELPAGTAGANGGGIEIIDGSNHDTIGGTSVNSRNVLGNNAGSALYIDDESGLGTIDNTAEGNYIGLVPSGIAAASNGNGVVLASTSGNTIDNNYICASNQTVDMTVHAGGGVVTTAVSATVNSGNVIEDNTIGLNTAGTAVPNDTGVILDNSASALVGDTVSGNTISGNTQAGVYVEGSNNSISTNTIESNGWAGVLVETAAERDTISKNSSSGNGASAGQPDLAIDLGTVVSSQGIVTGGDGVTANSPTGGTTSAGTSLPNGDQPYPVLSITSGATTASVGITLQSNPNTVYSIELFSNTAQSTSSTGHGEGLVYLQTVQMQTNSMGMGTATALIPESELGASITATATNFSLYNAATNPDSGATSEFALNVATSAGTGGGGTSVPSNGDATTGAVSTVLPFAATDFVENAAGTTVYATVPSMGEVVFINEDTRTVTQTVHVGTKPTGLALSADGSTLYVADNASNSVDVISTATGAVGTPIPLPGGDFPTDVQLGTNNRLFVLVGGTVLQINATTGASAGASFSTQSGDIRITPNGDTLLAANYGDSPSELDAFNVSGATAVKDYTTYPGSNGEDLEVSADGSTFALACGGGNGTGTGYSTDTYSVADGTAHSNVPLQPSAFAFSHDNTTAYAGQEDNDTIHVYGLTRDSSGVLELTAQTGTITAENPAQKMFSSTNGDLFVGEGSQTEIFYNTSSTGGGGTTGGGGKSGNASTINLSIGDSVTLYEGHTKLDKTDAFFTDTTGSGPYTATVNWGDGTPLQDVPYDSLDKLTLVHQFDGHVSHTYVVTVNVYDSTSDSKHTFDVTIVNNPPHALTVRSLTRAAATTNVPFEAIARFADAGAGNGDHFRVTIDYGDGTAKTVRTTTKSAFDIVHQYTHPGHYDLRVTVIDDGGGVATFSQIINVFAPKTTTD